MKKINIFVLLILSFCVAYAQGPGSFYPCPSSLDFQCSHVTGKAHKYKVKLVLYNASQNMQAVCLRISKSETIKWALVDKEKEAYFTAKGYANNILALLEGKTDEELEEEFEQYCDVFTHVSEKLAIVEILKSLECHFFPVGNEIAIGEFAVDLSGCEDGSYEIWAENTPNDYSFGYTGGVEGTCSWTADYPILLELYKQGDLVSVHPWFPMDDYDGVEEVEKNKSVASVRYYNLAGVESAQPVKGVNIRVTTYSDGTTKSEKMVR